jgi:hypothetical protein
MPRSAGQIAMSDVRTRHLLDENHPQKVQLVASRLYSLMTERATLSPSVHGAAAVR